MIGAGRLNEVIDIYSPVITINEYGEGESNMVKTYTTRARVENGSGSRGNQNNEITFSYYFTMYVRRYVPVTEKDEIEWQGNRYRILAIQVRREENDKIISTERINT
jgi:head-tail adaptor